MERRTLGWLKWTQLKKKMEDSIEMAVKSDTDVLAWLSQHPNEVISELDISMRSGISMSVVHRALMNTRTNPLDPASKPKLDWSHVHWLIGEGWVWRNKMALQETPTGDAPVVESNVGTRTRTYKTEDGKYPKTPCKFCGELVGNQGVKIHQEHCIKNPDRILGYRERYLKKFGGSHKNPLPKGITEKEALARLNKTETPAPKSQSRTSGKGTNPRLQEIVDFFNRPENQNRDITLDYLDASFPQYNRGNIAGSMAGVYNIIPVRRIARGVYRYDSTQPTTLPYEKVWEDGSEAIFVGNGEVWEARKLK